MKKTLIFAFAVMLLGACNNTANQPAPVSSLEQKRQELEKLKSEIQSEQEKQRLDAELKNLENELRELKGLPATPAATENTKTKTKTEALGTINADEVVMRTGPSTTDGKMDNFAKSETVTILESRRPQNANEAILRRDANLYVTSDMSGSVYYTVPKGKAVKVTDASEGEYEITYQHPEKGRIYAIVDENDLDFIGNEIWYKVKRSNGQTGWVFGKFLTKK